MIYTRGSIDFHKKFFWGDILLYVNVLQTVIKYGLYS